MRVSVCLLASCLVLAGCTPAPSTRQVITPYAMTPPVRLGEIYEQVRARLVAADWKPVAANCSSHNVCLGSGEPEMATNLITDTLCGYFTKGTDKIEICTVAIADGVLVSSISLVQSCLVTASASCTADQSGSRRTGH